MLSSNVVEFSNETGNSKAYVLYGKVNPSSKISNTFQAELEDNPSCINCGSMNVQLCMEKTSMLVTDILRRLINMRYLNLDMVKLNYSRIGRIKGINE